MARQRLEASIKVRLTTKLREALEQIAVERELDLADVVREALSEKVASRLGDAAVQPPAGVQQQAA